MKCVYIFRYHTKYRKEWKQNFLIKKKIKTKTTRKRFFFSFYKCVLWLDIYNWIVANLAAYIQWQLLPLLYKTLRIRLRAQHSAHIIWTIFFTYLFRNYVLVELYVFIIRKTRTFGINFLLQCRYTMLPCCLVEDTMTLCIKNS